MADNGNCWSAVDGPAVETRAPCVNGLEILLNPNSGRLFNKETPRYKMTNGPQNERVSHSNDMLRIGPQCVWGMQRGPEAGGGTRKVTGPPHPDSGVVRMFQRDQVSPMARTLEGPGPAPDSTQAEWVGQ